MGPFLTWTYRSKSIKSRAGLEVIRELCSQGGMANKALPIAVALSVFQGDATKRSKRADAADAAPDVPSCWGAAVYSSGAHASRSLHPAPGPLRLPPALPAAAGAGGSLRAGRRGGLRGLHAGSRAGGGRVSPARQGLRLLCCSLFPSAKVGVAGMSPLLRGGPSRVLWRGGMSASKRHKRGRFPKIKPSIPSRRCQCQRQARRCSELPAGRGSSLAARRAGPAAFLLLFLLLRGPLGSPRPRLSPAVCAPGPGGRQVPAEPRRGMGR